MKHFGEMSRELVSFLDPAPIATHTPVTWGSDIKQEENLKRLSLWDGCVFYWSQLGYSLKTCKLCSQSKDRPVQGTGKKGVHSINNENAWALTRPPATCPLCQYSCQKSSKDVKMSRCEVTWRHDVALWRHMTSDVMTKWLCAIYIGQPIRKSWKIMFFQHGDLDLWPTALTFRLLR